MSAAGLVWVEDQPVATAAFRVWGGTAELLVTDPRVIGGGERRLAAELEAVGAAVSRFRPDSELSALNAAAGKAVAVSPLFMEFLDAALHAAADGAGSPAAGGPGRHRAPASAAVPSEPAGRSESRSTSGMSGSLDASGAAGVPTPVPVPGWRVVETDRAYGTVRVPAGVALDFGATAKAHAADRAAWLLAQEFGCGVLVNLSGDVAVAGPPPAGGWPVRVADGEASGPSDPGQTVTLHDGGAATSGTTVRTWRHGGRTVHHIVDPATGDAAAPPWLTVTAVAGSCLDANTLTTAALVRGPEILPFLRQAGCPMRLLGADGRITLLGGWPQEDPR